MSRVRLRDLGVHLGQLPTGAHNAITDVAGVGVGHCTVVHDEPRVARTGVTLVQLRPPDDLASLCYGAMHSFNGNGEMTGSHWLAECGLLNGQVGITNTHQVGLVRDTLVAAEVQRDPAATWCLPIVGETYDGFLNDIDAFHLTTEHVHQALAAVSYDAPVAEGNVGGGTGMICHEFKGGIGTSSRCVSSPGGQYTVGALVQANYGSRDLLRLDGVPIGRHIGDNVVPAPAEVDAGLAEAGSIIVIIVTDAPLLADQCRRLAQRATVGLARVGGTGSNSSGDIFLAASTANRVPLRAEGPVTVTTLPADHLSLLFRAVAEVVEESIWNALCAAETMTGHRGRTVHAVPLDAVARLARAG
jgi:D-aminopeptidase